MGGNGGSPKTSGKGATAEDPPGAATPFQELLASHLRKGTRPDGTPGRRWSKKDFAAETGVSDRTVGNWLNGKTCPDDLESIERVLFGRNPAHDADRLRLREAFEAATRRGEGAASVGPFIPPDRCFGRDTDIAALTAVLTGPRAAAVAVLGPPGIGKTTLTRQVATSPAVVERFGERRWLVQLETTTDAAALRTAVLLAIGLDPASRSFRDALARLSTRPSLLVLDNLETPWEQDMAAVQDCLRRLVAVQTVTLLASMRGNVAPTGPAFAPRLVLDPLAADEAKRLFLDLAPGITVEDPQLDPFLRELGGVPLAIELVAYRAAPHDALGELWDEWQRRGVALATHPDLPQGRLTSVARSIDLSLQSRRLRDAGRRLFRLLGRLPAGMAREDRAAMLGGDATEAKGQLLAIGLALPRDGGRLDLLPPVRAFAHSLQPPGAPDADRWWRHYLGLLTTLGPRIGEAGGAEAAARLKPETANLEAAFVAALALDQRRAALAAADGLADLARFTGLSAAAPLRALAEACRAAGDSAGEVHCIKSLGDIALGRSDHDAAHAAHTQALTLFRQAGDALGEADSLQSLGDAALRRLDHDAACAAYERASMLFRRIGSAQGEAESIKGLGDVALDRSDHDAARTAYERALALFRRIGSVHGEANCIKSLGDIALLRSDFDAARTAYQEASTLFRRVGDVLSETYCIQRLGDVAFARPDHDAARAAYERALPLFHQIGFVHGEADCIRSLGDIAFRRSDPEAARAAYGQALPLFRQIGSVPGEASCIMGLGDIALRRSDQEAAYAAYEQALMLFRQAGHMHGEASCIRRLVTLLR
jgi:tetratricopeptide (TPR) repeat protein